MYIPSPTYECSTPTSGAHPSLGVLQSPQHVGQETVKKLSEHCFIFISYVYMAYLIYTMLI